MIVRCLECGFEMKTMQIAIAVVAHDANLSSGFSNQKIDESLSVHCPKCGIYNYCVGK